MPLQVLSVADLAALKRALERVREHRRIARRDALAGRYDSASLYADEALRLEGAALAGDVAAPDAPGEATGGASVRV